MPYEILLEKGAERDFKKLPKNIQKRVLNQILKLKENPRPIGVRKITDSKNDWRIRIGDYRVVYEIDDKKKIIKIFRIRHRKEVYLSL